MHLTLICKDRRVELSSCTRSVSLTGSRSNIHHINFSLPTALCCYWNIHRQHTPEQSWFSLYFRLQAELFFTSLREWWEQNSLLSLRLIAWWDPFTPSTTPKQHICCVALCGDKPYVHLKSWLKSCRGRSGAVFISHIQAAFIWTWNGLKAEDSVNKADRERDEKRIWHLQSQVLRELPGSEVQTEAARHTLKFQSPRSRECPVSPPLSTPPQSLPPPPPPPPSALDPELDVLRACLAAPLPLWPSLEIASVRSHSILSALYREHRGCDCPLCRPQIQGPKCASGLVPRTLPLHSWLHYTWAGQSQVVPLSSACVLQDWSWTSEDWWVHCVHAGSKQVKLHNPDVTGLSKTYRGFCVCQLTFYFSAAQPTSPHKCRLQSTGP